MGTWQEHIDHVSAKGLLAKRLYVILTTPTGSLDALGEQLGAHLAYQKDLEARGVTFAAGPFADDAEAQWSGEGMIIASLNGPPAPRSSAPSTSTTQ